MGVAGEANDVGLNNKEFCSSMPRAKTNTPRPSRGFLLARHKHDDDQAIYEDSLHRRRSS